MQTVISTHNHKRRIDTRLFVFGHLSFVFKDILIIFFPNFQFAFPQGFFGGLAIIAFLLLYIRNNLAISKYGKLTLAILILIFLYNLLIAIDKNFIKIFITSEPIILSLVIMIYYFSENDFPFIVDAYWVISYFMIGSYIVKYFSGTIIDEYGNFSYMGFGYGIAPYVALIMHKYFIKRHKIDLVVILFSCLLIIVSANRGAIVQMSITFMVLFLMMIPLKKKVLFFLCSIFVLVLVFLSLDFIISALVNFDLVQTTIIRRVESGEFFRSGRENIYSTTWEYIKRNPFFGYGAGADRIIVGTHSHNIILELWLNYGMVIGSFLFLLLVIPSFRIFLLRFRTFSSTGYIAIALPIYIMLFFSSSIYNFGKFWELIGLSCTYSLYMWNSRTNKHKELLNLLN